MLFLVFGSSAAGKTTALDGIRARMPDLAVHDFDELEPPPGAMSGWRHAANEEWLQRALAYQDAGRDLLLAGQTPFGELLATPSAAKIDGISACLIDCDDETRAARIQARGEWWFERTAGHLQSEFTWEDWIGRHISWAKWLREHAANPTGRPEAILTPSDTEMVWSRWTELKPGDPRWRVHVIDTTSLDPEVVVDDLASWIEAERALLAQGKHPWALAVEGTEA
jgi:hypothetical protein